MKKKAKKKAKKDPPTLVHVCDNCGEVYTDETLPKTLYQIHHLADRLSPGCPTPSGECGECGALTYEEEADSL